MAKGGRPKKYKDLIQFNLYIERSDFEVLKWVVEQTNKNHNTSAYTMAVISREIISQQIDRIKKSKDYLNRNIVVNENDAVIAEIESGAAIKVSHVVEDAQWNGYKPE